MLNNIFCLRWISIFIIFNFLSLSAQQNNITISGTIRNASDKEDIIGATVYIEKLRIGILSNEYGFYSLSFPKGLHKISYSYLGKKPVLLTINLQRDTIINLDMETVSTELKEITVYAEKLGKNKITSTEVGVQTMKVDIINKLPAVLGEIDIIKSIQLLPGITSLSEGANGFSVRGGKSDQNLILLDELNIYNASHLFGFFSIFNNDVIKDVKIYKGGIPAKYGGRISSVLDIHQKEGNYEKFSGRGGIGLIFSRLMFEGPILNGKGSFMIAGRRFYADLFLKTQKKFKDIAVNFYDLNLKTNYKFNNNNRIFISAYSGRDVFKFKKFFNNRWGNDAINLRWNHIFSNKLFMLTSVNYSSYLYDLKFDLDYLKLHWNSSIKNFNFKANFDYYNSNRVKFKFGLDYIYYDFNPGKIKSFASSSSNGTKKSSINNLDKKYALEGAFYANMENKLSAKLNINIGVRYSLFWRLGKQDVHNYENNEPVTYDADIDLYEPSTSIGTTSYGKNKEIASFNNIEPRASLVYLLNENNSIKLGYHKTSQYIHQISNNNSPTPLDLWAPSGKYIKPATADQYSFSLFKNFGDRKYEASVELYYKEMNDVVEYIDGADLIANNTIETQLLSGFGRAYGLEFYLEKKLGDFTGWLSYTLSKAEQKIPGLGKGDKGINNGEYFPLAIDKRHDVSLTGTYQINDKWTISSNFVFQTGRPATFPSGAYLHGYGESYELKPFYTSRFNGIFPPYHRMDIGITLNPRKNKGRRWQWTHNFGIYNVYNRKNAASIYFDRLSNTTSNKHQAYKLSIFGIVPSYTLNFKF